MIGADSDKNLPTLEQISAGGAVFRSGGTGVEVVIVRIVPEQRWQLPKGLIDPGETIEDAAVREVREESGVVAEIVAPIEKIEYWFVGDRDGRRTRFHKYVHFFLMRYVSGDVADHDHEVDESRWVTVETALDMLEFKSERDVVAKGVSLIERQGEI
jgi:8-oxo-dGTP pyrophosphatase MutT (NUDIX family)